MQQNRTMESGDVHEFDIMSFIAGVLGVGVYIGGLVAEALLNGWALSIMWEWFMVPTFAIPSLGVVPAMGVALMAAVLTKTASRKKPNFRDLGDSSLGWWTLRIIALPLLYLCAGWVTLQFM